MRVLQLNVARSNARMHAVLNSTPHDICLFQDPWWGSVGVERSVTSSHSSVFGTVNSNLWTCITPATNPPSTSPGVVVYYRKGLSWLDAIVSTDHPSSSDILPVLFFAHGFKFCIINVYLHGNSAKDNALLLVEHPVDLNIPTFYAGDFNLHHKLWSLPDDSRTRQTGAASDIAEWILSNDIAIYNTPGVATRRGKRGQRDSIIDLTLANSTAADTGIISDWGCSSDFALKSDHNAITWNVTPPPDHEPSTQEPIYRYTIDGSLKDDWIDAFEVAIRNCNVPGAYTEPANCEEGALAILDAMANATASCMPRTKVGSTPPRAPWWDDNCNEAVRHIRDCDDSEAEEAVLRLKQVIRTARRSYAARICAEISIPDVWKLTSWSAGKRYSKMPPIRLSSGYTTDPEGLAQAFQNAFFPSIHPEADCSSPLGVPSHPTHEHVEITHGEVAAALASSSNNSAPGAFGSSYRVLKWVFESSPEILTNLYTGCLNLGFHPMCLRNAVVVILPKPRKLDMSSPSSYHPISLLECLSKCLEKVIASRLLFDIGKHNLIPYTQFGGRDNSSCVDAAATLVHDVQTAWSAGAMASLLTLDIKGYFNNV